jgi:hypothetical protein
MKAFLGCLMCCVLVISQTFARDPHVAPNGGPAYPGTTANFAGTYAGVLMPTSPGDKHCASNSLGLFSLVVPQSGLASGDFVMFAQGRIFTGTVQAVGDPEKATMNGILDATFDFTVHFDCGTPQCPPDPLIGCAGSTGCDVTVTSSATGKFDADITSSSSISLGVGSRLNGSAVLNISQGQVDQDLVPIATCKMSLSLDGFKQSNG